LAPDDERLQSSTSATAASGTDRVAPSAPSNGGDDLRSLEDELAPRRHDSSPPGGGGDLDEASSVFGALTALGRAQPAEAPEGPESAHAAPPSRTGEGELLLVEDDVMVASTAVTTLQSFGYRVTHAADGERALEVVRRDPARFQLVLLDLRMPGLSGEATFEALQKLAPRLPVLIWSGYAAEQDVESMLRRGAVGFVRKPYRVAELSRTIAEAIRAPREPSAGRA